MGIPFAARLASILLVWLAKSLFKYLVAILKDKNVEGGRIFTTTMIAPLKALVLAQPRINEYVFNYYRHPIKDAKTSWRATLRRAGVRYRSFHVLRHTFATWNLNNGVDLATLQELLGHKDIKSMLVYAHLQTERKQAQLEKTFKVDFTKKCARICVRGPELEKGKAKNA